MNHHMVVNRFLKAVFNAKPRVPMYVYGISLVLSYLKTFAPLGSHSEAGYVNCISHRPEMPIHLSYGFR